MSDIPKEWIGETYTLSGRFYDADNPLDFLVGNQFAITVGDLPINFTRQDDGRLWRVETANGEVFNDIKISFDWLEAE